MTDTLRRLLFASALCLLASLPAAAGLPVELTDPMTGERQSINRGPEGLHIVVLATWCPECLQELDRLTDLEARWSSRGYELVLLAVKTRHDRDRLRRFASQRELPGRLLFDESGSAAHAQFAKNIVRLKKLNFFMAD